MQNSTLEHKGRRVILRGAGLARSVRQSLVRRPGSHGRSRRFFMAYCVAMILAYAILAPTTARPGFRLWGPGDFPAFYTAGHIIRDGNAHRLYDFSLQAQVQQAFLLSHGWTFAGGLLPYNYPPFFAPIFVPLSYLPLAWAFQVWSLVNIVLVLASTGLLLHVQKKRSRRDLATAGLVVLAFFPVFRGLYNGQTNFLILFVVTLSYLALKSKRDYLAGVTLALGLVKPQLVVVIAAMLLYHRRWRAVSAFGITGAVLLFISWMMVGVDGFISYVDLVRQMSNWDSIAGIYPAAMPNLRGTVYRLGQLYHTWSGTDLSPTMLRGVILLLSAAVFVLVLRTWKGPWNPTSPTFDRQFGQTVIGTLLVSPHLNGHDLTLLILVGFLVVSCFACQGRSAHAHRMIAVGHVTPALSLAALGSAGQAQVVALLLLVYMLILDKERAHTAGTTEISGRLQVGEYRAS